MNKRKILALAMSLSIVAILAVGATLAYFTDTQSATNTFTVGNVQIELVEEQRKYDENGTAVDLEDFEDGKQLRPVASSVQDDATKDGYGMSTDPNYVDKIVSVKNTGNSDAYVRVFFGIPAELDHPTDASKMALHWNQGNKFDRNGEWDREENEDAWTYVQVEDGNGNYVTATIDKIVYNVYYGQYIGRLAKAEDGVDTLTDLPVLVGVYLDSRVDFNGKDYTMGTEVLEVAKFIDSKGNVNIPVCVQAVQADGFKTADEAFAAAKLPTNPWSNN